MLKNRAKIIRFLLLVICVAGVTIRIVYIPQIGGVFDDHLKSKNLVSGVVVDDPEIRNGNPRFKFKIETVETKDGQVITCGECVVLVRSRYFGEPILYGDRLKFGGIFSVPEKIISEDGRTFNYAAFLAKDDIYYIVEARNFEIVERDQANKLVSILYSIKHRLVQNIEQELPSPHSFLGSGLIISGKGSMSKELQEKFQIAGLIHIVVLSGFNISIIGEAIIKSLSFLSMTFSSVIGGISIVLFSIMTGGGATVVRSAIMSLIALFARVTNRTNAALMSLSIAGGLMVLHNPRIIFHDPSFQLSFIASVGLISYSERFARNLAFLNTRFRIPKSVVELIASTFGTQLFTLPFIIHMSGLVSVIALLVNIIVLPVIPFTMLSVFTVSVTSFISKFLVMPFSFVSWILLSYELKVVDMASSISWSYVKIPPLPIWAIYLMYGFLLAELAWYQKRFMDQSNKKYPV